MSKGRVWNKKVEEGEDRCVVENLLNQKVILNYVLGGSVYSLVLRPREKVVMRQSKEAMEGALGQYVFSQTIRIV